MNYDYQYKLYVIKNAACNGSCAGCVVSVKFAQLSRSPTSLSCTFCIWSLFAELEHAKTSIQLTGTCRKIHTIFGAALVANSF